jgi:hypothetical protein
LPRACCWQMLGGTLLAQSQVAPGMQSLHAPTSHCGCFLIDTQLGRVGLHRWPVPPLAQVERVARTAHKALGFPGHGSCCFFPVAAMRLFLPFPSPTLPSLSSLSNPQVQVATWPGTIRNVPG